MSYEVDSSDVRFGRDLSPGIGQLSIAFEEAYVQPDLWTETTETPTVDPYAISVEHAVATSAGHTVVADETVRSDVHSTPGDRDSVIDEAHEASLEDYLTPEERKRRSTITWVHQVTDAYEAKVIAARQITKKSKREKQLELANRFLARQIEHFGEQDRHIVYDAEALGYALVELGATKPRLRERMLSATGDYLKEHPLEFAEDHPAFAGLIRQSLEGQPAAVDMDALLVKLLNATNYLHKPFDAARMEIAFAHAAFETTDDSNLRFTQKILDTVYHHNSLIREEEVYVNAWYTVRSSRLAEGLHADQLIADLHNARLTFYQLANAYVPDSEPYVMHLNQFMNNELQATIAPYAIGTATVPNDARNDTDRDFFMNPQWYEPIEEFNLRGDEVIEQKFLERTIPERWRSVYTESELYRKRTTFLAPRAYAHDIVQRWIKSAPEGITIPHALNLPLSPGLTLTFARTVDLDGTDEVTSIGNTNRIINHFMSLHSDSLRYADFAPTESRIAAMGRESIDVGEGLERVVGFLVVRQSVPEDKRLVVPHSALTLALRNRVMDYADRDAALERVNAKLAYIREHRHNYFGRRPISFTLPDELRKQGMQSIVMRQHPDRRRVIVTVQHDEGNVDTMFDTNLNYLNREGMTGFNERSALEMAYEDLVITLAGEWACRPVVETSEGTVSNTEGGSKVNLGFLRYLPEGWRFSERARQIFASEQHGNLAQESLRRRALDPTGLGRNSTYVRENYDPESPPLEVYYDPAVLA